MSTRVLITGKLHPSIIESFKNESSFDVNYAPDTSPEKLKDLIKKTHVIVTRSETKLDREMIDEAEELKVIGRAAVGVGNIDIDYATEKGILVINCPGKNTNSAAELTVGLMLSMVRNLPQAHQHMKVGGWDRHKFQGHELREKRLGIVGLGNVGHRVAKFANGFDMQVCAYDPYLSPEIFRKHGVTKVDSLEELASAVDILSVHVPLNNETTHMIDKGILGKMNSGSYVINAARGGVIHEGNLLESLDNGHIAGAAIDTWENEPVPVKALVDHSKVWVSPHIGATTEEAQVLIGQTILDQVSKAVKGHVVDYPVNLPQVGVIGDSIKKPFAVLCEKLGSLAGQLIEFNPKSIELVYRGDIADGSNQLLKLAFMKGYMGHVVDGYVSFVNAQQNFDKTGTELTETLDPNFTGYKSAFKIGVFGSKNESLTLGGTVFDGKLLRLSLIDDFYFEIEPSGHFLFIQNEDKPGVVGDLGVVLGRNQVNIDCFDLSRNKRGGRAMAVVRVDSSVPAEVVKTIETVPHILSVKSIYL